MGKVYNSGSELLRKTELKSCEATQESGKKSKNRPNRNVHKKNNERKAIILYLVFSKYNEDLGTDNEEMQ